MALFGTDIHQPQYTYTTEYSVITGEGAGMIVPVAVILLGVLMYSSSKVGGVGLAGIGGYMALKGAKVV